MSRKEQDTNDKLFWLSVTSLIGAGLAGLGGCTSAADFLSFLAVMFWLASA